MNEPDALAKSADMDLQKRSGLSGTGDSQRDSRESIRANHSQLKPLFYSASGRFARITRLSDSRESPDSRESCESIRANHATNSGPCVPRFPILGVALVKWSGGDCRPRRHKFPRSQGGRPVRGLASFQGSQGVCARNRCHLYNLEGKITIFTVLKWEKGRNHYKNHDLGHNH